MSENRGQHGTARPKSRKPFTRVSIQETVDILALAKRGVSLSEIARVVGISVQRVSDRVKAYSSTTDTALDVLKAHSHKAAEDWVRSFDAARKRGEHRPMKDCLVAVGVVSPDPINQGVTVVIGAGDTGVMLQAHSTTTIDVNPAPSSTHNPLVLPPIPHEPL